MNNNPDNAATASQKPQVDVSVVVPVFNECGHLAREINRIKEALEASSNSYEIVVVDDGSTDGSTEELLGIEGIKLIRFGKNRGTGSARKAGTKAAKGTIVVWTDADLTLPNEDIPRLCKELEGYDQVVGARTSEKGTVRLLRAPTKWAIRKLAGYLVRTQIPDLNCGFRAFRREVGLQFLELLPKGFSCTTTMTMTFLANGYSVKHIPIDYVPREFGKSKFHWWSDTKQYLTQVVRLILSYEPLRIFLPVGVMLTLTALAKLGFDVISKERLTTNTLLVFFAAFQTLSIGFLADLIVRTNRSRYDVDPASL